MKKAFIVLLLVACNERRTVERELVPVRTEIVKRTEFAPVLPLLGVVRAAQAIPLTAPQSGFVVYPKRFASGLQTGARVKAGETVVIIGNDQIAFVVEQTRLLQDKARADYDRVRRSFDQGVVSDAEFTAALAQYNLAKQSYEGAVRDASHLRIIAPAAGALVVTKPIAPRALVSAGTLLAEVAADGAPVIETAVPAAERALLRPTQKIRFDGGTGRIAEVAGVIDANGTARVVASIDGAVSIAPGTGVDVQVELDRRLDVLTVPDEAIVAGSEGPAVFVAALGEGRNVYRVRRTAVELGGRAGGRIEITSGLRDGDRIVVSGADALADDTLVTDRGDGK
ncbi:MAG TPA: efflux RND transporter periplasmic adaptor subunit [Thermoanaerobaculia bacterium]|nr:efflux RND transporter periplasmic adaptor subunit [Thermoanaerobaculia bacterium]